MGLSRSGGRLSNSNNRNLQKGMKRRFGTTLFKSRMTTIHPIKKGRDRDDIHWDIINEVRIRQERTETFIFLGISILITIGLSLIF